VCDFKSKFIINPNPRPESPHEFQINKKQREKLEVWKEIFISMLVDRAFKTDGNVADCDVVMATSNKYRESQDLIRSFCEERVIEREDKSIKRTEIHEEFKCWYVALYGVRGMPKAADLYEHLNKTLGTYNKKSGWKGYKMLYGHEVEE
jgi:hypothetical protein